jgi:sulfide dehydrogenase [flavocytochrome c] flavoprotein subunit
MPKSGFSASNQAKITASAIIALLNEKAPTSATMANTCYSFLSQDYAISVSAIYQLSGKEIVSVKGSGGISSLDADLSVRRAEAIYAQGWYDSITNDMFG